MANGIQTANGKAFEYSCVEALYRALSGSGEIVIESSPQLDTAKSLYEAVNVEMKTALDKAADAAVRVVKRLEPQLWNGDLMDDLSPA